MLVVLLCCQCTSAQQKTSAETPSDSSSDKRQILAERYLLREKERQKVDSMASMQLQNEILQVSTDSKKRKNLEDRLRQLSLKDSLHKIEQVKRIAELKRTAKPNPVKLLADTLFNIYTRIGSFSTAERAKAISGHINALYNDAFFKPDSLVVMPNEATYDIVYQNNVIMSVAELDALWYNEAPAKLAEQYLIKIKKEIAAEKQKNSLVNWLKRFGYICLIFLGIWLIVRGINYLLNYSEKFLSVNKEKYFKGIKIRTLQLLSADEHYKYALRINNIIRLILILLIIYLALPLFFSVFPQTKSIANLLISWILTPAKAVFDGILGFLPNLFTILVIYLATRYLIKFVKYFATEIDQERIRLGGFYKEWAWPTFNIIKVLIYAFMFVIIFPYLPGSKSPAFQGVSVFLGILLSLGSSSAISNVIAGLVITYMRPFKKGDRVKIGEVTGDVIEKTMLVTRIRTIKNEDVTVPNSTVLNTYTINYTVNTNDTGLIVHTTVTIGYDVPWKDMHQALIDAALRVDFILKEPLPFVLQTSLDDFYVSYQINAYTKEAGKQAFIYSQLHQHIQDVCNERGIEIMSPHYNTMRDGNMTTIPASYLPPDYKTPGFQVTIDKNDA
ncbi:mechanosensitive ion channel domain-containing protein [Mucilaginibacter sp.]|uniref:mechanosensitive ion channel domain-containing protein n=1 Tax=Mucilaginibacter sp. TaxID=1882438 RepID=UPI003B004C3A